MNESLLQQNEKSNCRLHQKELLRFLSLPFLSCFSLVKSTNKSPIFSEPRYIPKFFRTIHARLHSWSISKLIRKLSVLIPWCCALYFEPCSCSVQWLPQASIFSHHFTDKIGLHGKQDHVLWISKITSAIFSFWSRPKWKKQWFNIRIESDSQMKPIFSFTWLIQKFFFTKTSEKNLIHSKD